MLCLMSVTESLGESSRVKREIRPVPRKLRNINSQNGVKGRTVKSKAWPLWVLSFTTNAQKAFLQRLGL